MENDNRNQIGFIVGRYRNDDGMLVTTVNVDAIKSTATNYEQNLRETINIYHLVVQEGVESISSENLTGEAQLATL